MAKGQKKSNREHRKPKQAKAAAATPRVIVGVLHEHLQQLGSQASAAPARPGK